MAEGARSSGRIEGGIDAVVIGGTLDGYVAAAMLGAAKFNTVLVEAGVSAARIDKREFAPGFYCEDGEPLITHLDPKAVDALNLYKHGLGYAERRMETMYFFADHAALTLPGDIAEAREFVAAMSDEDAERFGVLMDRALAEARDLRPVFQGDAPPKSAVGFSEASLSQSIDDVLANLFSDDRLKSLVIAETAMHSASRPSDPFSYLSLLRRLAGEAAGLQGAVAYPKQGVQGLANALRRAAQSAGVEIRQAQSIRSVLVEWDAASGVQFDDGGQIRAPIIVNALSARRAFLEQIGADLIDLEFQRVIEQPPPMLAAARVNFALQGAPRDGKTKENLTRRLVFAPDEIDVRRAFRMAKDGEVSAPLLMELTFPSAFDKSLAPDKSHVASGWLHPIPYTPDTDDTLTEAVREAAIDTFEQMSPGVGERLKKVDIVLPADRAAMTGEPPETFAAMRPTLSAWDRARLISGASGVRGYFFCGPEAQIGRGPNGAAGRRAAEAAIRFAKRKGAAA